MDQVPAAAATKPQLELRPAEAVDIEAIAAIYGHHVLHGSASFETEPPEVAEMARRRQVLVEQGYPYLVAKRDDALLGYSYASAYRQRAAYQNTVENSVYLRADSLGQGIGTALLKALIEACEQRRYRQMIAVVGDSANAASIQLHLRQGFTMIGTLRAVGRKHERWLDTVLLQRSLGHGSGTPPDRKTLRSLQ